MRTAASAVPRGLCGRGRRFPRPARATTIGRPLPEGSETRPRGSAGGNIPS